MKRLAVLGQPIAHSLSPAMHNAAFAALGMAGEWSYEAIELAPDEFAAGVSRLRDEGYVGANVTIPHKVAALELAGEASAAAREIGAANTLTFGPAGVRADNTDAPGLLAALPGPVAGRRALVLGAGGAARAAVWALLSAGADVAVHNRTRERAAELVADLGGRVLDPEGELIPARDFDVLVNATSIGLEKPGTRAGNRETDGLKAMGLSADGVCDPMVVVDLVYGSEATELSDVGRRGGADVVDGLEILVRQGAESFRIWTGREPPLEVMRQAVREPQR
jgi:shikimate dehydrogenase